MFFDFYGNVVG